MPSERAECKRWLEKALNDWRTAETLLARRPPITDTAAFHTQQAVEKTLKAFLFHRRKPFEKIHDLKALAKACTAVDPAFDALRRVVAPLTPYAVRFRYPGPADPTADDVSKALEIVRQVWEFVLARLPAETRPDVGA